MTKKFLITSIHCLWITVFGLLTACSDSLSTASKSPKEFTQKSVNSGHLPVVLESFSVGDNVYVRSLAVEKDANTLWVGTSTGVHAIDLESNNPRLTFTRQDGLANEYVFAIHIDSLGYKWFGTNAGGTSRYRDGKWQTYFPLHGLADYWIYSFAEQDQGKLWIGTWAGVNLVDLETMKFQTFVRELINEWVYAIDIDSRDQVWFGTEGGISMFDGSQWRQWTHADGVGAANTQQRPASANTGLGTRSRHDLNVLVDGQESYNPNYIFSLKVDSGNNIWAGTWGGGVTRYDGKKWRNYTTNDGLAGNIVYSIATDDQGVLWFGTNQGLSRFDGKQWTSYGQGNGLLGNDVYAIATTENGYVWVGTKNGVSRIGLQ